MLGLVAVLASIYYSLGAVAQEKVGLASAMRNPRSTTSMHGWTNIFLSCI